MTPEAKSKLRQLLVKHEGKENFPYIDTVGKITIGIGYNLSDRGMPDSWINQQYEDDVTYFYNQLNNDFPWFKHLTEARQAVLMDMCFMGYKRFLSFKKMLACLAAGDYQRAALEMLDSKWAQQVHGRAHELADIMASGIYPEGAQHGLAQGTVKE